MDHILEQVDAMPARTYLLNNNGGGLSLLFWRPEDEMVLTPQMRSASWYGTMPAIRDQLDHVLCAAFTACDLVSAGRFLAGWDLEPLHYSVWYLCRHMDPLRLGRDLTAPYPHVCYRVHTTEALEFMQAYGVRRALPYEGENCRCREQFPLFYTPSIDSRIRQVVQIDTLGEALNFLHLRPIATYLIVFPELAYIENEMYIGPTTRDSLFCGYHAVTIMAVGYQNRLRFAICRQNNGLAAGASGYVKVSLSVVFMVVGAPSNAGINPTPTPTHLLSNFSMIICNENGRQQWKPQIKRDDEKDEEEEKEDRKRPRLPEKAGKGEEVRKRQRIAGKGYSQSNVVFEAAWALTNIASGASEETKAITDSGYSSEEVREQAVLALGYVAGDSSKCLEHVCKALMPLMGQFNEHSMLRNGAWTLSNFCRGKPQPAFEQTKAVVPESAHHPSPSVLIPALLPDIGNIVIGDDMQTQALSGLLKNTYKKSIKKETCWAISNITVEEVIQAGLTQLQIGEFQIKKEAFWAISNAACGGNHDQIKFPMRQGCIKPTRVLIQGS